MSFPITGTFIDEITYDIPASNWSDSQWKNELDCMCETGVDTLIFIRGGFGRKTIFPSSTLGTERTRDFLGFILAEAEKREMRVFVGLYISNIDWNKGDWKTEIEINRNFISEIYLRYSDFKSFAGWYIPHETSRDVLNISEVMYGLSSLCKEKVAEKQVLISPFFESRLLSEKNFLTPEKHYEEWNKILHKAGANIDICAFQDGTAPIDELDDYFGAVKRLCNKYKMQLWVNTETFERDVRGLYPPISFSELEEKISHHKKYADKIITFEFSHFMSPQSIFPSARNLYGMYVDFYGEKK